MIIDPMTIVYIAGTILVWLVFNAAAFAWRFTKDPQED